MITPLPLRPNLEQYQKKAKDLLVAAKAGDAGGLARIEQERARDTGPVLADAQLAIAREHGITSWARFKRVVEMIEPFRAALYPGDADVIRKLLDEAPELAICEPWPSSPGYKPIEGVSSDCVWHRPQQTQVAGMLADAGAGLDITIAARAGLVDYVRQMLDDEPTLINTRDKRGRTAMYRAGCVFGRFDEGATIVDLLLERGAELDFYVACTFGMAAVVERMLSADATWATRLDPDGMTCLHWAARHRGSDGHDEPVAVTQRLLAAGADVHARNPTEEQMQSIHHCAEWAAYTEQVDLLLQHGAEINAVADKGWAPLDHAMDRGRKEMISYLEAKGGRLSGKRDNA